MVSAESMCFGSFPINQDIVEEDRGCCRLPNRSAARPLTQSHRLLRSIFRHASRGRAQRPRHGIVRPAKRARALIVTGKKRISVGWTLAKSLILREWVFTYVNIFRFEIRMM